MGVGLWAAGGTGASGQNQAIDPVNVAGQGTPAATGAAPALAPPATAAAQAPQQIVPATQAVTPPNVAPPAAPPPAAVVSPAAPATGPATIAAPTPVAPGTAPANAAATSAAPTTVAATAPAEPQKIEVTTVEGEGKAYPVTELKIEYLFPHPQLPSVDELLNTEVQLGVVDGGYVAPRTGIELVRVKLGDIGKGPVKKIFRSGITAIYGGVLRFLNSKGIIGVFVVVNKNDIQIDERDSKRDRDARLVEGSEDVYKYTSLNIQIVTSVVKDIRTVAIGESSDASRVNNPRDAHIKAHSPLQPAKEGDAERNDLLRKDLLDDYVLRLNRYTGRHVDVAVSGTNKVGELNLDYLVSQGRPWYAFAQIANTGTSQTAEFRERFGYVHNELTGHDDVLSLDYATAGFSKSHSIMGAYEIPFFDFERVRTRVYGNWNEYTASDVGINSVNFSGSQWLAGAEAIINVYQKRDFFIDAIGGVRTQYVDSNNETAGTPGKATFFEPYGGFKFERLSDISSTTGLVMVTSYITSDDQASVDGLGRVNVSLAPVVMHFDFDQSFFLEPLIDPQRFSLGQSTLAHEIFMTLHGQYGFGNRLFPQAQDVVGGLYSVRGYPESIVSGDNVVVGSLEYRLHIPRLLPIQNDPSKTPFLWNKSFRFSPQQAYAKPDWDLLFRTFIDAGVAVNASRQTTTEKDASLIGAGVGLELQYKQNFNLRVDWGAAITPVYDGSVGGGKIVDEGSQRVHISATILY
jgi:hypothetical protein